MDEPLETPLATFADRIYLETATAYREGDNVRLELVWRYGRKGEGANVFVHALDADGVLVEQADGPAVGQMLPFWLWQPGDRARDIRWLPASGLAEIKRVKVGLYNSRGERLPAFDIAGTRYPDDGVSIPVERAN